MTDPVSAARMAGAKFEPAEEDVSTSDEAVRILLDKGVDAWREWVVEQLDRRIRD